MYDLAVYGSLGACIAVIAYDVYKAATGKAKSQKK